MRNPMNNYNWELVSVQCHGMSVEHYNEEPRGILQRSLIHKVSHFEISTQLTWGLFGILVRIIDQKFGV
jgi:hypothetical protein